jgi:hypothetical protein
VPSIGNNNRVSGQYIAGSQNKILALFRPKVAQFIRPSAKRPAFADRDEACIDADFPNAAETLDDALGRNREQHHPQGDAERLASRPQDCWRQRPVPV